MYYKEIIEEFVGFVGVEQVAVLLQVVVVSSKLVVFAAKVLHPDLLLP
jgi:hypothetical protein